MTNIILTTRSRRLFLDDFIPLKIKGKHKASGYTDNIISDFSIRHFLLSLHRWRKSAFFFYFVLSLNSPLTSEYIKVFMNAVAVCRM